MAFDQASLQRIRSMKSMKAARISTLLNIPFTLLYGVLLLNVGVVLYAYFAHIQCDPLKSGAINSNNQLAPYFVLHSMADLPGMAGFYLATLFCGSLSTLSSGINALAAIIVEGVLPLCACKPSERRATILTKLTVAAVGSAIVGITFAAQYMHGPVTQMVGSINGSFGSPVVGVFLLSSLVPWANKYGVSTGVLASVAFMLTLTIGGQMHGARPPPLSPASVSKCHVFINIKNVSTNYQTLRAAVGNTASFDVAHNYVNTTLQGTQLYSVGYRPSPYNAKFFLFDISYEWYTVLGTLVCMTIGLVVSFWTRHVVHKTDQLDPKLIMPFCRKFWIKRGHIIAKRDSETDKMTKPLKKSVLEIQAEPKLETAHTSFIN